MSIWNRACVVGLVSWALPAVAQQIAQVSVSSSGEAQNGPAWSVAISTDGRWVAFASTASNLVAGDSNHSADVFVRDLATRETVLVSVGLAGVPGNGDSGFHVSVSSDGRFVAFDSRASDLVAGDSNRASDVFARDRDTDGDGVFDESGATRTTRVSVTTSGQPSDGESYDACLSSDGRYIAFSSNGSSLWPGRRRGQWDVFVRDRDADGNGTFDELSDTTTIVSVDSAGQVGNAYSYGASISSDGRFIGFITQATNLFPIDDCSCMDPAIHDRSTGATIRAGETAEGVEAAGSSHVRFSADGRFVAFSSFASILAANDENQAPDVFVRDRDADGNGVFDEPGQVSLELESADPSGAPGNGWSTVPAISANGRWIAFESTSSNLIPDDTNGTGDVFLRDRETGRIERITQAEGCHCDAQLGYGRVEISGNGAFVAFISDASDLVAGDTNGTSDAFVRFSLSLDVRPVVPASGSEAGGDLARVFGTGFEPSAAVAVRFDGILADVLAVSHGVITVRTPAGHGVVDLAVQTAFASQARQAAYEYLPAPIAARAGTVNVGLGDRENPLLVNAVIGDPRTRELVVHVGQPIQAVMIVPPTRATSRYVLYGWGRAPSATTLTPLPRGLGTLVFAPPFLGGSPPVVWNNIGHTRALGAPTHASRPAPSSVFRIANATAPLTLTLQGLVEDDGSPSATGWSVTNAIVLRIR